MIRRTNRRRGLAALQAVLLLGAGFLVVWGLMDLWKGAEEPVRTQTEKTLRGEIGNAAPGRGGGAGATSNPGQTGSAKPINRNPGIPGGGVPAANNPGTTSGQEPPNGTPGDSELVSPEPPTAAERLAQVAYDLYLTNKRFRPEELQEIKEFLQAANEHLDTPLAHLVLSEVNLRQGNRWEGFTELLTALNPVDIVLGRLRMAKQVANRLEVVGKIKPKGLPASRKALGELEDKLGKSGGGYNEISTIRKGLPEELRTEVVGHHIPPKSVSGLGKGEGPAIIMWKKDHELLPTSRGPAGNAIRKEIDARVKAGDRKGAFELAEKEVRDLHGNAYDKQLKEARDYAIKQGWLNKK